MKRKTIKKSAEIKAAREKVWDVLLQDKYTRTWYAVFSEGAHAETDWKLGSKAVFLDNKGSGIIGRVVVNKPQELISIEYNGIVAQGVEDYESDAAKDMAGALETYRLSEKDGLIHLSVECEMPAEFFDGMSLAWDKAIGKIKEMSEAL